MLNNIELHKIPIREVFDKSRYLAWFILLAVIGHSSAKYLDVEVPYEFTSQQYRPNYETPQNVSQSFNRYTIGIQRNIFETEPPPKKIEKQESERLANFNLAGYELTGTFVSGNYKLAGIFSKRKNQTEIFSIGQNVFDTGAVIKDITKKAILLEQNGQEFELAFPEKPENSQARLNQPTPNTSQRRVAEPKPVIQASPVNPSPNNSDIQTEISFQRSEIDDILNNRFGELLREARVVPKLENGKIVGYTIKKIKSGSLYEKLGLKNGDLIVSVNGETIESPERAFALFRLFRNEPAVFLEVERNKTPITFSYYIQ